MCSEHQTQTIIDAVAQLIKQEKKENDAPIDGTVSVSSTQPLVLDYKNRKYIFIWSPKTLVCSIEDIGTITILANVWTNISFQEGTRLTPANQTATVAVFIRCTHDAFITSSVSPFTVLNLTANGNAFSAIVESTSTGGGGSGTYQFSLFNPTTSTKDIIVYSIIMSINFGQGYGHVLKTSTDPALAATIIPINLNLVSTITSIASLTTTAIPNPIGNLATEIISPAIGPNFLQNDAIIYVRPGSGVNISQFVDNSQAYAFSYKWIEI